MTAPLTPESLAELRRLAEAATPRPWSTVSGAGNVWHFPEEGTPTVVAGHQRAPRVPDAELIAAAVNALPALLDAAAERDALAAKVEAVRALALNQSGPGRWARDEGWAAFVPAADLLATLDEEPQPRSFDRLLAEKLADPTIRASFDASVARRTRAALVADFLKGWNR